MEFGDELEKMTKALEGESVEPEVKPEGEVVVSEETKTEEVVEKSEEKKEEEVVKEEPKVKEPESKEEPKVEDKDAIIADLQAKLAAAMKPKEEALEEKKEEVKEEPLSVEEHDFVGSVDLDDLTRDPKEFNKLLNKIYKQAVVDTRRTLGEGVLKSIPDIVKKNVEIITNLKQLHDTFYNENKDLEPFKKAVAYVFEEVASQNQGKSFDEILKLTGPEVRKRLNLQKVVSIENKKSGPPNLPGKGAKAGSLSTNKPQTEGIQNEIESMMKSI